MKKPYSLICGDALSVVSSLEYDVIVTDPPYGIGFKYDGYEDTRENLSSIIRSFIPTARRKSKRVVILPGPTQINLYPQADWVGAVIWNTTGSFGRMGYNQWTPILLYGEDVSGFGSVNGITKSDVIRINGGGSVGFTRSLHEKLHPCPKPLGIMRKIIQRFTKPDEIVADFFMGSGTIGVACIEQGRSFLGVEINPKYYNAARERIEIVSQQQLLGMTA